MQMLSAAGVEVVGNPPYFEPVETVFHQWEPEWIAQQTGVVKLLHPTIVVNAFPKGDYRSIWLTRDIQEQSSSLLKMTMNNGPVSEADRDLDRIALTLGEDRVWNTDRLGNLGELMLVSFEDIINKPKEVAARVCDYFAVNGDLESMVSVIEERSTAALPTMELEDRLIHAQDPS